MKKRDIRTFLLTAALTFSMIGGQAAPVLAADLPALETAVVAGENEDQEALAATSPEAAVEDVLTDGADNAENPAGGEIGSAEENTQTGTEGENDQTGSEAGNEGETAQTGAEGENTQSGSEKENQDAGGEAGTGAQDDQSGSEAGKGEEPAEENGGASAGEETPEESGKTGEQDASGSGEALPAEENADPIPEESTELETADVTPTVTPTATPTPTAIPAAVVLPAPVLKNVVNKPGGVLVIWKKVPGAVTYRVYRKTGSGKWTKLGDTTETNFVDPEAVSGTTYNYTVRCLKVGKTYKKSSYDKTGLSIMRLSQPVLGLSNTAGGVKVHWLAVEGATQYYVYRQKADGSWETIAKTADRIYTDKVTESGKTFAYTVRAVGKSAAGKTCKSSYLASGESILYLARPVVKTNIRGTQVTVSWDAVPGATAYRVMRKASGGKWKKLANVTDATSYIDKTVKAGETWQYSVRCLKPVMSAYDTKTTKVTVMALPKMNDLMNSADGITISWEKVKGATAYRVYRKVGKGKWKKLADVTDLSYVDKKAPTGSILYYKVRGKSEAGLGILTSKDYKAVTRIAFDGNWTYASNSKISSGIVAIYRAPKAVRKGIVVCINAGHGTKGGTRVKTYCHPDGTPKVTDGTTGEGATFAYAVSTGTDMQDGTEEAAANLKVALITKKLLLEKGYDVLMIRDSDDVQLDNVARTLMANAYADCHIAIHYDYTTTDKGAFYMSVPEIKSYRNMEPVKSHWKQHHALGDAVISGLKASGVKICGDGAMESDLTQTSYSTIPSIDLEVGDEASPLTDEMRGKLAAGILAGLDKFFA